MPLFRHISASILLTAAIMAQAADDSAFRATTTTVLVPFNVQRGKYLAEDLQSSDFVLREDGHPREFTVFEGPNTPHPLPLELVLVFDTARIPPDNYGGMIPVWDPKADYEFLNTWDESATQTVLQQSGMDIRISVYRFDDGHFERLCRASRDPHEIGDAFRRLLSPITAGSQLTPLPGNRIFHGKTISSPGWWQEATVAALRDVAGSPIASRRVTLLFSDLGGGTRPAPGTALPSLQAIANEALALGIEIDPVILDLYKQAAKGQLISTGDSLLQQPSIPVEMPDGTTWYATAPRSSILGELAGGEALFPEHLNRDALGNMLLSVRDEALSEYLIGFVPQTAVEPGKHKLRVELKPKTPGKIVGGEREGVVY